MQHNCIISAARRGGGDGDSTFDCFLEHTRTNTTRTATSTHVYSTTTMSVSGNFDLAGNTDAKSYHFAISSEASANADVSVVLTDLVRCIEEGRAAANQLLTAAIDEEKLLAKRKTPEVKGGANQVAKKSKQQ